MYTDQITRMHFLPNVTINVTEYKNGKTEVTKLKDSMFMDCVQSAIDEGIDWVAVFDKDEFLDNYCQYPCGQMSVNLVPIGSVNQSRYVSVPVTRRFQFNSERDKWAKGIVNLAAVLQELLVTHFPIEVSMGLGGRQDESSVPETCDGICRPTFIDHLMRQFCITSKTYRRRIIISDTKFGETSMV